MNTSPSIPFLITARLSSVRLPKKLLRELDGTEVVSKVIERAIKAFGADQVVLCTSPLATDDELVHVSERHGIGVHRGHPMDILLRLCGACRDRNAMGFVGQTGENPIFQLDHCLRMRDLILEGADLVRVQGLPIGCSPYAISRAAIETLLLLKEEEDTGFWGYFLNRPELFNVVMIEASDELRLSDMRLTVDYPEDLDLMKALYAIHPGMPDLKDVVATLKSTPSLRAINGMRTQGDLEQETKDRIAGFFVRRSGEIRMELMKQRARAWK